MPQPAYVIDELISAKSIAARVETLARGKARLELESLLF
jgi:hypothetical protein